ncbi:MAG: Protease 3 precursor [Syntrophorhabdaceae bacterium PtaU1.Bin034]|nr:MAG: Protease 3 precursor [Syntrophorhabdaceae bacterium PtaU1.Bin034]
MALRLFAGKGPLNKGPFPFFLAPAFLLFIILLLSLSERAEAMDTIRLDNGLKCILEKRAGVGVVAVQVWVKVGSRSEDDRVAGITHFIEHLIFKGTEKGEGYEIAPKIEALGGSINAFTSYDNTVYHIVIPKKSFETGLQLLADSVISPSFPEKELEKEKKVVIEEIKMGEDDPQRKLFKELFSASYPNHPYGRPIIGYKETVAGITRSDILTYFKEHYVPENMALVVTGDFDEQHIRKLLEGQLSWKPGEKPKPSEIVKPGAAARKEDRLRIIERGVTESYLAMSYPINQFVHPDTPPLEVLSKILTDGDSSRLQSTLKHKKGLVTDSDTYLFAPREKGLFVIIATFKGRDYQKVTQGIEAELDRISREGIEPWEIEKAKNLIRASYVYSAETVQGKARQTGNFQTLTDDPLYADKYLEAIDRVGVEDVKRVLTTYLRAKDKSTVVLMPKTTSNPSLIQLENGLRFVYNRNTASPTVSFMIGFVGGVKEEREGRNGSFNVLSRMLLRGTRELDSQAIARKIDTLAGNISPVSGRNVFGLSGKFLAKDFPQGLDLLRQLLRTTVFKDDELRKVKEEIYSDIRRRDDDPVPYTFYQMYRLLYEGHPYAKDTLGSAEDVGNLRVEDVEELYRHYVGPRGAVLAVSGDIEQKKAEELVRRFFSDWKGEDHELKKLRHEVASARKEAIDREMFQTHLTFTFVGPGLIDADRYGVEVMNAILSGMGGRMHKRLREENPYAYAVTFFNQEAFETGAMGIYIGTDRTHVKDVERIARAEIEQIRREGFTEEEVANAKRYMIGNHYIRVQTNGAIASSMCLDTIYGLQPDTFKLWPERADKVTRDEVNSAARKYLVPEKMVMFRLGPIGPQKTP